MSKVQKTVKITENDLVELIDKIVKEAIEIKKTEWIAEQAEAGNKTPLLEQKLGDLEKKILALTAK